MTDYKAPHDVDNPEGDFYKKTNLVAGTGGGAGSNVSPREKRNTLLALLLALGILQTLYMNLAAFFPIFAEEHYPWVQEAQVGIVLA